jgi:DNA-binding MarR family transcriptional regulator
VVDKILVQPGEQAGTRISDEAVETSRLLVEFLHAAYATRRLDAADTDDSPAVADPVLGAQSTAVHRATPPGGSVHAVRAAIHVYQHGERTVGQLASGLGISYGWASRIVEELEAHGYVIREQDAVDRRIVRVRLNPDALEEVERAYRWRGRAVEEALATLAEPERGAVRAFLRRLTELLREGGPTQG